MRLLFLTLCFATMAPAWAGGGDMDAARGLTPARFEAIAGELGLDATQRKAVSDAVYQAGIAKADIDARSGKAKLEVKHLLGGDTLDEKALMKAVDTLNAAEGEMRKNRVGLLISVRKTLTADQWTRLVSMRQERKAERRGRHGDDDHEGGEGREE